MLKPCYRCKQLVPAGEYEAHVQQHRNNIPGRRQLGNDSRWPGIRRRCLERHGYRCVVCGRTRAELRRLGLTLDVHHRNGDNSDNSDENLEPRCSEHHEKGGEQPYG